MAEITVLHYQTAARRIPFQEWVDSLTDKSVQAAVLARVNRLRLGTFGDWKSIGDGVCELRIHQGCGLPALFRTTRANGGDPARRRREAITGRQYQNCEAILERL